MLKSGNVDNFQGLENNDHIIQVILFGTWIVSPERYAASSRTPSAVSKYLEKYFLKLIAGYHQKPPVEDQSTRGNEDQGATKV